MKGTIGMGDYAVVSTAQVTYTTDDPDHLALIRRHVEDLREDRELAIYRVAVVVNLAPDGDHTWWVEVSHQFRTKTGALAQRARVARVNVTEDVISRISEGVVVL